MSFIMWCLFWIIGVLVGSTGLGQILIILRFAVPFTIRLSKRGAFHHKGSVNILRRYALSILMILIIEAAVTGAVYEVSTQISFYAFLIGIGITFIIRLGKFKFNEVNLKEYIKVNIRYFDIARIEEVNPEFSDLIFNTLAQV